MRIALNFAQLARLIIAFIFLTFVCHISVRFIGMPYDDPMALYAANQHYHLCNHHNTHPGRVKMC